MADLTQAFRNLLSSNEAYASYRISSTSPMFCPNFCAANHFFNLLLGIGGTGLDSGLDSAGCRKGSAPEGEAWLLEGTRRNGRPANLRNVYVVVVLAKIRPKIADGLHKPATSDNSG